VIDGSNIRDGGGVTHLSELLNNSDISGTSISNIIIYSNKATLNRIDYKPYIIKRTSAFLEMNIFFRFFWQIFLLSSEIKVVNGDILFAPGGLSFVKNVPVVTMCQNHLPFDLDAIKSYGDFLKKIKWHLLRILQLNTFKSSSGIIFLSNYSRDEISRAFINANTCVISHAVSSRFSFKPKAQLDISKYSFKNPFKFLYVSSIDYYKNHPQLIAAFSILRSNGIPVSIDFIGPINSNAYRIFNEFILKYDISREWINYLGPIDHKNLLQHYANSDGFIWASSCETFGMPILEAMACGLPICCSASPPMPEIALEHAFYFNPLDVNSVAECITRFLDSKGQRLINIMNAHKYSSGLTWKETSRKTFGFISDSLVNSL
jgi:glycosyltransferase involved in cell wall biosynthesis